MGRFGHRQTRRILAPFNIIIMAGLAACSGPAPRAPVTDVAQPPSIRIQEHLVAPGETLYSIAWRYNLDHRDLARANGIDSRYRIYEGQRLTLDTSRQQAPSSTPAPSKPAPQVAQTTPAPKAATKPAPTPRRSENQTATAVKKSSPRVGSDPGMWQWPLQGKILASFQSNGGLNKGIDIQGKLGEPVRAAAGGNVVYSGSGLRGYGNLIIVKHSEKYLSAYAHNSKLLVEEGAVVKAGQQIAQVGSSGTDTAKLHFEIRYDGQPVNPLKYLPTQ